VIIRVKLKPFHEWPCQRTHPFAMCGAREKLSGLEIELDGNRPCKDPERKGRAWGITGESLQRMHAVGALARYAMVSRQEGLRMWVCEHMVEPWSLRKGLLFARFPFLLRSRPLPVSSWRGWPVGQYFNTNTMGDWSYVCSGKIIGQIGERGEPLYQVLLFSESPPLLNDDPSREYLLTDAAIDRCWRENVGTNLRYQPWKLYDSLREMVEDYERHKPKESRTAIGPN
jgi:hypothetical protein